jgi:hypothetical protein
VPSGSKGMASHIGGLEEGNCRTLLLERNATQIRMALTSVTVSLFSVDHFRYARHLLQDFIIFGTKMAAPHARDRQWTKRPIRGQTA